MEDLQENMNTRVSPSDNQSSTERRVSIAGKQYRIVDKLVDADVGTKRPYPVNGYVQFDLTEANSQSSEPTFALRIYTKGPPLVLFRVVRKPRNWVGYEQIAAYGEEEVKFEAS